MTHDINEMSFELAQAEADKLELEWEAFLAEMEATPREQRAAQHEVWEARFLDFLRRRVQLSAHLHRALQTSVGSGAQH